MKYYIYISDTKVDMLYEQLGLQAQGSLEGVVSLRDRIRRHFNKSELQDLCLELGLDYEDLAGEGIGDKARELILLCYRHGRINDLIHRCQIARPEVDWHYEHIETDQPASQANRYTRLNAVVKYLEEHEDVGSVDKPSAYFHGSMYLRWGFSGGAIFVGNSSETVLVLGGSAKHVIGVEQSKPSYLPLSNIGGVLWTMKEMAETSGTETSNENVDMETDFRHSALDVLQSLTGPEQRLEFLAKRLSYVDASAYEPDERDKSWIDYANRSKRRHPVPEHPHVLFGTPIFVALVE